MTRSRSSRGRHRRRERPVDATHEEQPQAVEEAAGPPAAPDPPRQHGPPRPGAGEQPGGPRPAFGDGPRPPRSGPGEQGQRPGQGRGNRRRQQRRHQMAPMSAEVLKARARVTGGGQPIEKRTIPELDGPDGPVLGCPMLTRTRLDLPVSGGHPAPRCSLAWAIHSEREARYCMETYDLTQCWRAHPERLDEIKARLGEPVGDRAAD